MAKITFQQWVNLLTDPETTNEEIMAVSLIKRGEGGLDFSIVPNPEFVELGDTEEESFFLDIGNGLARLRRQAKFTKRRLFGETGPILVSEMDSWGQFPVLIEEIVDHLDRSGFLVWSVGAAGDTLDNMVNGPMVPRRTEYMLALNRQKEHVKAFLFSGAGNDVIGDDPNTNKPALLNLINEYDETRPDDVIAHINEEAVVEVLQKIEAGYRKMISSVRTEFVDLPILIHGYDYCFPYPWEGDNRNPLHAAKNAWLGKPLDDRSIPHEALNLRRGILIHLIDRLYSLLNSIADDPTISDVHVIDCRGAMPTLSDWEDEIHGTSDGFSEVAARFKAKLSELGIHAQGPELV